MNLISCANCGVVLDRDMIAFPDTYDDSQKLVMKNVEWDNDRDDYVAVVPCPVCGRNIKGK